MPTYRYWSSSEPLAPSARVFLYGVAAEAAQALGFTVVDDPSKADVAIVRAPAPYQSEHTQYFFGSRQHEGRLEFTAKDEAYARLLEISRSTPTVFVTTLERPLILTNVQPYATALIGDFGISDAPLLRLLTGSLHPTGHLPFNLLRSEQESGIKRAICRMTIAILCTAEDLACLNNRLCEFRVSRSSRAETVLESFQLPS